MGGGGEESAWRIIEQYVVALGNGFSSVSDGKPSLKSANCTPSHFEWRMTSTRAKSRKGTHSKLSPHLCMTWTSLTRMHDVSTCVTVNLFSGPCLTLWLSLTQLSLDQIYQGNIVLFSGQEKRRVCTYLRNHPSCSTLRQPWIGRPHIRSCNPPKEPLIPVRGATRLSHLWD